MGGEILLMIWWVLLGIAGFFLALFFVSCAILSHFLDSREEEKEDWF